MNKIINKIINEFTSCILNSKSLFTLNLNLPLRSSIRFLQVLMVILWLGGLLLDGVGCVGVGICAEEACVWRVGDRRSPTPREKFVKIVGGFAPYLEP